MRHIRQTLNLIQVQVHPFSYPTSIIFVSLIKQSGLAQLDALLCLARFSFLSNKPLIINVTSKT
jgi:hypothetical protein